MPDVCVTVPHRLTRAEARRRITSRLANHHGPYSDLLDRLEQDWDGDMLEFSLAGGPIVTGQLLVEDNVVRLKLSLPWYLQPLASGTISTMENMARHLLNGQ